MSYYNDIALALSENAEQKLKEKLAVANPEIVALFTKYYDAHHVGAVTGNGYTSGRM